MHEPRDDERRGDAQRPPAAAQRRRIAGVADQPALIQNVVNKEAKRVARSLRTQQETHIGMKVTAEAQQCKVHL